MVSIILGMGFGWCSLSHAQMGGLGGGTGGMGGGIPTIPGAEFGGVTDPSSIQISEGLKVVPSIQVAQRYDSNVFFTPKSQLPGLTPEDFVTSIVPQVRGVYTDHEQLVKVNAVVGAVGGYYVNNGRLNYVGANAGAVLDMSDLLSRWRPGTKLTTSNVYFYSPEPPTFLQGGEFVEQANPVLAGFQARRNNTSFNRVSTVLEFPINRTVSLSSSYTNSFVKYGTSQISGGVDLIDRKVQTYSVSLRKQVSLQDTVRLDFMGSEFDLGERGVFSARGGNLGWIHRFSSAVSFTATGGVYVLSGELNRVLLSSGNASNAIAPFGSLAILWQGPTTSLALRYQSGIAPSAQFQGAVMLNHTVSLNMTQNTPIRDLVGLLGANYSAADTYGSSSSSPQSWTTVRGTAGLMYRVTQKTFLIFNYSYLNVDNVVGARHSAFEKHMVQLSLAQAFY